MIGCGNGMRKFFFLVLVLFCFCVIGIFVFTNKLSDIGNAFPNGISLKHQDTENNKEISFEESLDREIKSMTMEEKAGQLLIVGFSGYEPDYYINRMINLRHIGGVILFSRNIKDPVQVGSLANKLQALAKSNRDPSLFIAVDQEWGEINRFKEGITLFPGSNSLGKIASAKDVYTAANDTAKELKAIGINVNFAPVVDLAFKNGVMYNRSYGKDPQLVANLGEASILGSRNGGIIPAVKHFPGLGRAMFDPHQGAVKIDTDLFVLNKTDLIPFKQALKANIEMVMVSNALYPKIDAKNPACFSYPILTDLLRHTMGYKGIIVTDDLEMGAALSQDSVGRLAVKAINAGADIVLVCHTPEKQREAYEALLSAIKRKEISKKRLNDSLKRILTLKLEKGIGEKVDTTNINKFVNTAEHKKHAEEIEKKLMTRSLSHSR
jgi:beta-N-acetylhexosaminidase